MQINNIYIEDFYDNKENENINNNVFNINPKISKTSSLNNFKVKYDNNNNNRNEENTELRRNLSLKHRIPNNDKKLRERRAKSISFADISELSNSNVNFYEKNKYSINKNYKMNTITNQKDNDNLSNNKSYSNLGGKTILARKKSFRKPKVFISSKEHIRRLKKMKSSSAISYKNDFNESKIKRRYSLHSPPIPKSYSLDDDDFYGDKFDESYSDLPPNTLYHELKQAHEKELLQKKLENKNKKLEVLDEETMCYDTDSTFYNISDRGIDEENNSSFLKFILKYLENSINKVNSNFISDSIENDIKENISRNIIEKEIKEEYDEHSFQSESSQILEEESELHKQEELLESLFNDVIKNFYGYQTKFYHIIIKLISFLLYNWGKMEIGSHILKYFLKDKLGISMSSSDELSLSSIDINKFHFENEDMEFITLHDVKENKKHQRRRKKGYETLNKFWMAIHSIFIFIFLYIFLMSYHSNNINEPLHVLNLKNINQAKNDKNFNKIYNFDNNNKNNKFEIFIQTSPVAWLTPNNNYYNFQSSMKHWCFVDEFTEKKINKYINNEEYKKNIMKENIGYMEKRNNFTSLIKTFTPWKCLVLLEFILFSAQLGFHYFIMDEIVPFFKPASYTSILYINQVINFFVQYKFIWKMLYNDLCLYLFILGIYIVIIS